LKPSIIHHVGRRSGRTHEFPVVAVEHGGDFFVALLCGDRTDWMKSVLASGKVTVVSRGECLTSISRRSSL
jgi:deazaflavin-dependent oxidoreductase (nitroreductase family)